MQRNDVLDLQCAVVNEDAFDHELEDGLPVAGRRGLQAASDPAHEAGEIDQGLARPKALFAELVLHLTLLLDKPPLVGDCAALLGQLFEADHFGSIGLQEAAIGAMQPVEPGLHLRSSGLALRIGGSLFGNLVELGQQPIRVTKEIHDVIPNRLLECVGLDPSPRTLLCAA